MEMIRQPHMSSLDKWRELTALHDRNESLFYKVVIDHVDEMAPIVYTPTVGEACQKFSAVFRSSRGLYFSLKDRGEFLPMTYNWPVDDVQIIVVTDGSRILGLGDLGVQGMGISIGKLDLYVAGAGLDPMKTLPVCIDVGTNNRELAQSPLYLGIQESRCNDEEYFALMDEFMDAIYTRWPNVLVQFEDFQNERAVKLLKKYRHERLCFNDDIQGTGTVTVAGILCALRAKGLSVGDLVDQRIVIVGAGSAGIGVAHSILQCMQRHGLSQSEARKLFYFLDSKGLMTTKRLEKSRALLPGQEDFLREETEAEGFSLLEVVKFAKPQIILGLSCVPGLFTPDVCREMAKINDRPIIFPMSNPLSKAECTAQSAFENTDGKAIFASGSPFADVTLQNGKVCYTNQANNMFIFPGVGLGAVLGKCEVVSDEMLMVAAETLANSMSSEDLAVGKVYPNVKDIRKVSRSIAIAVINQAVREGNCDPKFKSYSKDEIEEYVDSEMYMPGYTQLVYRPEGKELNQKYLLR
jgi:malic enzyme